MEDFNIELEKGEEILWRAFFIDEYGIHMQKRTKICMIIVLPIMSYVLYNLMFRNEYYGNEGPEMVLITLMFFIPTAGLLFYVEISTILSLIFGNYQKRDSYHKYYLLTTHRVINGRPELKSYSYSKRPKELQREKDSIAFKIDHITEFTIDNLKNKDYYSIFFNHTDTREQYWLSFQNIKQEDCETFVEIFTDNFGFKRDNNVEYILYKKHA